jgi:hypothetical protein
LQELQRRNQKAFKGFIMSQPEAVGNQFLEQSGVFQDVADLAYQRAAASSNQLGLEPYGIEGGLVVPVVSHLRAEERLGQSELSIADGQVLHEQRYPVMWAGAVLVGLWPGGNQGEGEAALYRAETTFQPPSQQASLPLTEAAPRAFGPDKTRILDAPHLGSGLIIGYGEDVPCQLLADAQTSVEVQHSDHADYDESGGADRLVLYGKMTARRVGSLLRVDGDAVYVVSPRDEGYKIEIPGEEPVMTELVPTVPKHRPSPGPIRIDGQGRIVRADKLREFPQPQLPFSRVIDHLTGPLPWEDATSQFLEGYASLGKGMRLVLALDGVSQRRNSLYGQAMDALTAAREEQPLRPAMIGNAAVLAALRAMPESPPYYDNLVTMQWLGKK